MTTHMDNIVPCEGECDKVTLFERVSSSCFSLAFETQGCFLFFDLALDIILIAFERSGNGRLC